MLGLTHLIGFGAADSPYIANATRFNATQYLARGAAFTGAVDTTSFMFSFWFNMKGADGTAFPFIGNSGVYGNGFNVTRTTANKFQVQISNPPGTNGVFIQSAASFITTTGWKHVMFNYNNALPQLYISDVVDAYTDVSTGLGTLAFTQGDTWFGNIAASAVLNAEIADFWWGPGQTMDISVTANRRKAISAAGKPVYLGADGSLLTGVAPLLFLPNPFGSFQTNLGSGGGMTLTGTLAAAATSPST